MSDAVLAIGTRKGLFVARAPADRGRWEIGPIRFSTNPVGAVAIDASRGRLIAAVNNPFWGTGIIFSDDLGETWSEPQRDAADAPIAFPEQTGASLANVWQLRVSPVDPDVVYAGAEPAALFRSNDGGRTFALVEGLWEHPHRPTWQPGGGGLCLHTILLDPAAAETITVAISTGGVYRSTDGGKSWQPRNKGIRADFMPDDPLPEYGQCVHKVDMHPGAPNRLFLQHHGGVYRSDDATASWTRIDAGLPADFGFPIVVHPHRPESVYVLPLTSDMVRTPAGLRYQVCRSDDAGETWRPLTAGLPTEPCYGTVLRDAMCADAGDPAGVYFGTRDGSVFASNDEGESWTEIARHLPDVLCVRAAVL